MANSNSALFGRLLSIAFERIANNATPTIMADNPGASDAAATWFPEAQYVRSNFSEFATTISRLTKDGPVLAIPPWNRSSIRIEDVQVFSEHDAILVSSTPQQPDALLCAIVPTSTLISPSTAPVRAAINRYWQIALIIYAYDVLPPVHRRVPFAAIFLKARRARQIPVRIFRIDISDEKRVVADFERLLDSDGGRHAFGYVVRDNLAPGESLSFERHDPKVHARATDLSGFGNTVPLGDVFDIRYFLDSAEARRRSCDAAGPDRVRILSGRDLGREGRITPADEQARWIVVPPDLQVREGDFLLRALFSPGTLNGFTVVEATASDLPCTADNTVVVLRPREPMQSPQRLLVSQYLRSKIARTLFWALGMQPARLTPSSLSGLPLPQADNELSLAIEDLAAAAERFELWREEANRLLDSVFTEESAKAARARIVHNGRALRLRSDAASMLDDEHYMIRTRFPYPLAHRWRGIEASISAADHAEAYEKILESAEVLFSYAACLALALARDKDLVLGYVVNIREKLSTGKSGLGFGDWIAVLTEIRDGKSFRGLPDSTPLAWLKSILASSEAEDARKRLMRRRNDHAHLRRVDSTDLPAAVDSALRDLTILLKHASGLSDLPLVYIDSVRWDSIQRRAFVNYRELMGDHSVVPMRTMQSANSGVEAGSLYIMSERKELHLLRPFLLGRNCPTCRNWSTFHVDHILDSVATLKSLEHGHTTEDVEVVQSLRLVGLLPS